ncbi:MAG: hypothetical protein J6386_02045 [Candidatus Synoicihabitans palmerolidicus]|nr:hypothetical protein [Candidatus Synoicihabitans palmerolidicus]
MCRNQEILPVPASLFLRYLLFSNLLRLLDTLYLATTSSAYPKTIYDLARIANDPAPLYRSPEKAIGLNYPSETALELTDPVYVATRDQGMAMVRTSMEGVFANH